MRKIFMLVVLLAAFSATAFAENKCDVIDLMPDFWGAWDAGRSLPSEQRVTALRSHFLDHHLALYRAALDEDHLTDKQLAILIKLVETKEAPMRRISTALPKAACNEISRVRRLAPLNTREMVYIWPSLVTSDGTLKEVKGKLRLFIGPDVIAYARPDETDSAPFLDHELFHLLHSQNNTEAAEALKADTPPLYQSLWTEGLATFVGQHLNPDSKMSAVLSSATLEAEAAPKLADLARQLGERLDSTDKKDLKKYFYFCTTQEDVPVRAAYYVGLKVAEDVFKNEGGDWKKVIGLNGPELRSAVRASLTRLGAPSAQPLTAISVPGQEGELRLGKRDDR